MACYAVNCHVAALRSRLWYQWFVALKVLAKVIDLGFRLNFGTIEELNVQVWEGEVEYQKDEASRSLS